MTNSGESSTIPGRAQSMRPFLVIWTGQAFSLLGSRLVQFALVWWLTKSTGSATVLAMASMAALLPRVFLGPFAGALVDRWDRRMVMMVADSMIAIATVALAVLYGLGAVRIWHIYVMMLIRATGAAFHWPAMQASTTLLVPRQQLSRVAGLNQTIQGLAMILMPPLGALAIEALPMQGVLAIDVATAILAIAPLTFIPIPQPTREVTPATAGPMPSVLADMREGLRFVLSWKGLLLFSAIGMLCNMLGRAAASMIPIMITQHFGGGALELGWMQSAIGIGAVVGGIALGAWGGYERRITTVMLALALDGIAVTVVGLAPSNALPVAMGAVFMAGLLDSVVMGLNGAIFQAIVPPAMQGRVFALLASLGEVTAPLGLAVAGPVADALGAQVWYLLAGIIIAVAGMGALLIPAIMHIEDAAPAG